MVGRSQPQPGTGRRASSTDGSTRGGASPIVELLVVFVVVFAAQVVTGFLGAMTGLFVLSPPLTQNPWTIVTSVYAHAGVGHLLSNAVALVLFGWPIARATTRFRFHTFFLVTGALAGTSQIVLTNVFATLPLVPGSATAGVLGASGAVFALMGYLLAANRLSEVFASVIELPQWAVIAVFVVLAAIVTFLTAQPGVALVAHFSGFLIGLIAGRAGVLKLAPRRQRSARR